MTRKSGSKTKNPPPEADFPRQTVGESADYANFAKQKAANDRWEHSRTLGGLANDRWEHSQAPGGPANDRWEHSRTLGRPANDCWEHSQALGGPANDCWLKNNVLP